MGFPFKIFVYIFALPMRLARIILAIVFCIFMQETNAIGLGFNDSTDVAKSKFAPWSKGSTMLTYAFSSGAFQTHEIRVEYFVHPRWSLLYSTSYSMRPSYGISTSEASYSEFRAPIGLSLGVGMVGISACSYTCGNFDSGVWELVRLSSMIPDGIAFHIPVTDRIDLSPFINVSGLVFQWDSQNNSRIYYSPMGGIRLIYPLGPNFVISAEQNIKRMSNGSLSSSLGGGLSVIF